MKKILEEYPNTREDNVELILRVWEAQGLKLSDHEKAFIHLCFPLESVTRMKRQLRAERFIHAGKQKPEEFVTIPKV